MASTSNRTEEEVNGDSDELQQDSDKSQKKSAKHDSGASDLEKVTDFMEEKEIKHSEFLEGVCVFAFRLQYCLFITSFRANFSSIKLGAETPSLPESYLILKFRASICKIAMYRIT